MPKKKKATFNKVTKKAQDKHNKMLEANREQAGEKWKTLVSDLENLGYKIQPAVEQSPMPGMYAALIRLRGMSIEEYDRHQNPEKWAEIDAQRQAEADKALKEDQERLAKAEEEVMRQVSEVVENAGEGEEPGPDKAPVK